MLTREVASIQLEVPREIVFATISDYNSYEKWMPGVSYSHILAQDSDIVVAEFAWPIFVATKFNLEFIHSAPEFIIYAQTDQYRERGLSGRWDLKPAPDGRASILTGEMSVKAGLFESLGRRRKLRATLENCLAAVAQRVRTHPGGPVPSRDPQTRTKILEVVKGSDALQVWLFGEVYRLEKRREDIKS
jgi:ribosome-associated toxin RatA of RatAB toxin-antitoxin module